MKNMRAAALTALSIASPGPVFAAGPADARAVQEVLAKYQRAMERLDASGTESLFAADSQVFESGGVEGTYANYLAHHLRPELGDFKSFKFSNYKVIVRFEGPVAIATESYTYRIEPKSGDAVERLGVATSVLRQVGGKWRIAMSHNSSRKPKAT